MNQPLSSPSSTPIYVRRRFATPDKLDWTGVAGSPVFSLSTGIAGSPSLAPSSPFCPSSPFLSPCGGSVGGGGFCLEAASIDTFHTPKASSYPGKAQASRAVQVFQAYDSPFLPSAVASPLGGPAAASCRSFALLPAAVTALPAALGSPAAAATTCGAPMTVLTASPTAFVCDRPRTDSGLSVASIAS
eukprot:TRINITY_DN5635_c0_g2_i1.p1 TRINITY_DN5635_c0_g2~~TRINITY_DN5635_c0_g2_i1.p1  ORF type:complete len:188 (-),score=12.06 TRINITY_DN5635_c0_g2_i1:208-771(-)